MSVNKLSELSSKVVREGILGHEVCPEALMLFVTLTVSSMHLAEQEIFKLQKTLDNSNTKISELESKVFSLEVSLSGTPRG